MGWACVWGGMGSLDEGDCRQVWPSTRCPRRLLPTYPTRFFFDATHPLNFRSREDTAGLWRSW